MYGSYVCTLTVLINTLQDRGTDDNKIYENPGHRVKAGSTQTQLDRVRVGYRVNDHRVRVGYRVSFTDPVATLECFIDWFR